MQVIFASAGKNDNDFKFVVQEVTGRKSLKLTQTTKNMLKILVMSTI